MADPKTERIVLIPVAAWQGVAVDRPNTLLLFRLNRDLSKFGNGATSCLWGLLCLRRQARTGNGHYRSHPSARVRNSRAKDTRALREGTPRAEVWRSRWAFRQNLKSPGGGRNPEIG